MLTFITKEDIQKSIEKDINYRKTHTTKRNGNSISLRPIVYNCIREIYFEVFDYPRLPPTDLTLDKSFYWTGPIGSAIHEKLQDLTGLSDQQYTEQLMTFKSFYPLHVRSKCDGIDLRDPNNIILYEIKTKDRMPNKPYHEELLQNLLSVFFFRNECKLDIKGSSMVYVNRADPYDIVFHNYDFFDITSPIYLDIVKELTPVFEKVTELLQSMNDRRPPSMESKFIKKFAYGKFQCEHCVYRDHCEKER